MEKEPMEALVIKVIDNFQVVINKGEKDGITKKDIFLVYSEGENLCDPITKKSLGKLEIVHGKASVEHLQPGMTTIASNSFSYPSKKVITQKQPYYLAFTGQTTEENGEAKQQEFKNINTEKPTNYKARRIE